MMVHEIEELREKFGIGERVAGNIAEYADFAVLYTSREVTLPALLYDTVSKSGFLKRRR